MLLSPKNANSHRPLNCRGTWCSWDCIFIHGMDIYSLVALKHMKTDAKLETPKRKPGRPSTYTLAKAEEICGRIASGETLVSICAEEGMPGISTVIGNWLAAHEEFAAMYARAKEVRLDVMGEEILHIADTCRVGEKLTVEDGFDDNGRPRSKTVVVSADMVERARLQLDTRKFLLAKLRAHVYGDRVALDHSGEVAINVADGLARLRAASEAKAGK